MTNKNLIIKTGWNFDNSYARLPELFFTRLKPTPVSSSKLVVLNRTLATSLGLNDKGLKEKDEVEVFAGNRVPEGAVPLSQAYAGHQFGRFTMLGDGRAILIGEQISSKGERFDIQLKGSGRTPYSRGGDGRATLGPMLREYIISEAMYALGIPTTRSLAVVTTGESVTRQTKLPGAILTRVAASHIRVGTFQYVSNWGNVEELRTLADYTLERHFPGYKKESNPYVFLLQEVIKVQAKLIARWQLVGFIHGVMNTDNMTISGETIDYGPCAFMDQYDPSTVFSSIDINGRYAYGNQPSMAAWNLARFAETLLPLLDDEEEQAIKLAENTLSKFSELYRCNWLGGMRAKLGIFNQEEQDESLIEDLFSIMHKHKSDYTNTFRALTLNKLEDMELFKASDFKTWYGRWQDRLSRQEESKESSQKLMKNNNPAVIPRNHRVEAALESAEKRGDYSIMERLLDILSKPYAYTTEQNEYSELPPPSSLPYRTFCGT
ncbi:YdiU family protein [Clostridium sp. D2Q-11]|uniref:Protein nucleotidyltransferase YdiU n=1 Tax=Anaeromonas frigoriresistens TaxID=2683708 RepID=A0A942UVU5_9FIRM|nr:YdiU family protein [Anaeromonas frigoriresistens]MBS4537361.1 YdiU family protein [Anaeromonas frigoriresistens]